MKAQISSLLHRRRIDYWLVGLIFALLVSYLLGMHFTQGYEALPYFDASIVMDSAETARNTLRGDFLVTKYILPVGYMYFPTIVNHPDFIRYPGVILLYAVLFFLFSPSAIVIKLLNAVLFLINGWLIYRLVRKLQANEGAPENVRSLTVQRIIAFFVAYLASVTITRYFLMALSDNYEVIGYFLLLVFLNVLVGRTVKPVVLGVLCGLLYLTKPTFSLFIFIMVVYYLIPRIPTRKWFVSGLLTVAGFLIVVSPFIVRSLVYTGQPMFALQHKVDTIKEVELTHDELFKSFAFPPPTLETITTHKAEYFARWKSRVQSVFTNLASAEYLAAWFGLPFFLVFFKKQRGLAVSYLVFLVVHIVVVANYLTEADTARVYTSILAICVIFGLAGIITGILVVLKRATPTVAVQKILVAVAVVLMFVPLLYTGLNNGYPHAEPNTFPEEVAVQVKEINPPCLYSNRPYLSAWFLDIPTIYAPFKNSQMLTHGPDQCLYFLYRTEKRKSTMKFLDKNGRLLFENKNYRFYQLVK